MSTPLVFALSAIMFLPRGGSAVVVGAFGLLLVLGIEALSRRRLLQFALRVWSSSCRSAVESWSASSHRRASRLQGCSSVTAAFIAPSLFEDDRVDMSLANMALRVVIIIPIGTVISRRSSFEVCCTGYFVDTSTQLGRSSPVTRPTDPAT